MQLDMFSVIILSTKLHVCDSASVLVPWGAIGGGLGAAVFVIVIAVIILFLLKRRGFFVKKEQSGSGTFINPLRASSSKQKPDTRY